MLRWKASRIKLQSISLWIGIVHAVKKFQQVMVGVDENRVGRPTLIDLKMLEG